MERRSSWGLRRRAVVSALVVTTLALLIGGALLMWILQTRLLSGLRSDTVALAVGGHEKLPGDGHEAARWWT